MNQLGRSILLFAMWFVQVSAWANVPQTYTEAKQIAREIWQENRATFYCGCRYDKQGLIDFNSCDFSPRNKRKNKRIEWEHVVPVSWYGQQLPCWRSKNCTNKNKVMSNRACCQKTDPRFRKMETDLHNLVPCERDVNRARANFPFVELTQNQSGYDEFQGCQLLINDKQRWVAPPNERKGWIARINLYMIKTYSIPLSKKLIATYEAWDKAYPPSAEETAWLEKVNAAMSEESTS